jgi:hypothetical protein
VENQFNLELKQQNFSVLNVVKFKSKGVEDAENLVEFIVVQNVVFLDHRR